MDLLDSIVSIGYKLLLKKESDWVSVKEQIEMLSKESIILISMYSNF